MKKNKLLFLIILTLILIVIWLLFIVGPRVANDFPYTFQNSLKIGFNLPQIWSDRSGVNFGEFVLHTLWAWPMDFLYGLGGTLGLNFSILEKILGIIPAFTLGAWSIYQLLKYFGITKIGKVVGALLYITNTYFLLLIDGGQISIALAYSILPLVFLLAVKSTNGDFKSKLFASLATYVLGVFDIRFIYVLMVLLFFKFLFDFIFSDTGNKLKYLFDWITLGIVVVVVYSGLNAYWILPSLLSRLPELPASYTRLSQTAFLNFTDWKHAISLLQPNWYKNVFGEVPPFRKEFLLIPILAFLAPVLKRKNKTVWFWTVVALVSVFLTKGASAPFGDVYNWLFIHLPGFSLFRDSTKFFFLVALSYSVLTAFTVDGLIRRFPKIKFVLPILLAAYYLLLVWPVYIGKMTGTFSNPPNQNEYFSLANTLGGDKTFGRILWIPSKAPLGFASPVHSSVDALTISSQRPFATGTVGTYEFLNFLREAPYMGEIMKIAGIKYLAYPYPDIRRVTLKPEDENYYHVFLAQLESLPWVKGKVSDFPIPVLETKSAEDHFFVAPNTYYVIGSDALYSDLAKIKNFDLSKNALVWGEENFNQNTVINKDIPDKIILFNKNLTDLAMNFIPQKDLILPAKNLDFNPKTDDGIAGRSPGEGWWKRETSDFVWFRDFIQQKYGIDNADFDYGAGYAIAEGERKFTMNNLQFTKGNVLMARVLKSSKGGKLTFFQGGKLIGEVDTKINNPKITTIKLTGSGSVPDRYYKYDTASFDWVNVGNFVSNDGITIESEGGINVVNVIAPISKDELASLNKQAGELKNSEKVIDWGSLSANQKEFLFQSNNAPRVTYKELGPTHYKVAVSGLKNPSALIFSESYDPMWTSNRVGSFEAYGLVNAFKIDKDCDYDIYFEPQKYVLPGLSISAATLVLAIFFCII